MEPKMEAVEHFLYEQHALRRNLHEHMMVSLREMVKADLLQQGQSKLKNPARTSIASIGNISLYLTAHHRMMSSLLRDIADGKIYKMSRKMGKGKSSKKKEPMLYKQQMKLLQHPPQIPESTTMIKEELALPPPPLPAQLPAQPTFEPTTFDLNEVKNEVEDIEEDDDQEDEEEDSGDENNENY